MNISRNKERSKSSKVLSIPLITLLFSVSLCLLNGCSLMGYQIGKASDIKSKPNQYLLQDLTSKKSIKVYNITLRNGAIVTGKIIQIYRTAEKDYAKTYASAKEKNIELTLFPDLGDQFTLNLTTGKHLICNLLGFDNNQLEIKVDKNTDPKLVFLNEYTRSFYDQTGCY